MLAVIPPVNSPNMSKHNIGYSSRTKLTKNV